ncbi:MAG: hypothetical protein PVF77_16110 [Anaerolineae bacterium]|jgi:hypothetical protein
MNSESAKLYQLQALESQDDLSGDGAIVFVAWLLALVLSIIFCLVILSTADPEVLRMFAHALWVN